jgi:hypothetical protein
LFGLFELFELISGQKTVLVLYLLAVHASIAENKSE